MAIILLLLLQWLGAKSALPSTKLRKPGRLLSTFPLLANRPVALRCRIRQFLFSVFLSSMFQGFSAPPHHGGNFRSPYPVVCANLRQKGFSVRSPQFLFSVSSFPLRFKVLRVSMVGFSAILAILT
jgi:hypothetical protein